jgi:predicted transposase/invertase (TIGR01784 family)
LAVLWLRFLREVEEQQSVVSDDLKSDAEIRQALELCETGAYTDAELAVYDAYWDAIRVENSLIYEGIIEGIAKGRAEGIAEGEKKKLINIVLNCRRNSFSIEQMQAITGLGEEELQEILRSNFFTH